MVSSGLASAWENSQVIRGRFRRPLPWLQWPVIPFDHAGVNGDDDDEIEKHTVSTKALELNADALLAMLQFYNWEFIDIPGLQAEAWYLLKITLPFTHWYWQFIANKLTLNIDGPPPTMDMIWHLIGLSIYFSDIIGLLPNGWYVFPAYALKVKELYHMVKYDTKDPKKDSYRDAWDLRRLYTFAWRRQRDAQKRGQTPRDWVY